MTEIKFIFASSCKPLDKKDVFEARLRNKKKKKVKISHCRNNSQIK